jgi:two-component system OmpR family sensor kinase
VVTIVNRERARVLQIAEPLAERREALLSALLWLTLPLAVLLGFTAFMVFRASRSLVTQVERTAKAVSRQDPQALGLLPLDDVVTEMRPAVEATNRLLGRLADALESERSFTYNSAHELRTPIAGALAQAQLLVAMTKGTGAEAPAVSMVGALSRLARLAERLLALARAEGTHALADELVDLPTVLHLIAAEFGHDPRLRGREIAVDAAPARVLGDLDAAGLALRNLVENAIVHAPSARTIRIACRSLATGVVLSVADDGPGVPTHDLPLLAKRFVRGPGAAAGGAGLGLSIVATLARRMGADFDIQSPPEGRRQGLEARLTWPRSQTARASRRRGAAAKSSPE